MLIYAWWSSSHSIDRHVYLDPSCGKLMMTRNELFARRINSTVREQYQFWSNTWPIAVLHRGVIRLKNTRISEWKKPYFSTNDKRLEGEKTSVTPWLCLFGLDNRTKWIIECHCTTRSSIDAVTAPFWWHYWNSIDYAFLKGI